MMNRIVDRIQVILKYGPVVVWALLNVVMITNAVYTYGSDRALVFILVFTITGSMIIYLFNWHLVPHMIGLDTLSRQRFSIIVISEILLCSLSIIALTAYPYFNEVDENMHLSNVLLLWVSLIGLGALIFLGSAMTRFYYEGRISEYSKKVDRVSAELDFLKHQISPHFLFNTLNNIYGLAFMGDKRSAKMILMLSRNMRYLLYECGQPTVSISKEAELITNYLNLQQFKFDIEEKPVNIDFYQEGMNDDDRMIPMVLINFVENGFKHADIDTNENAWIRVVMEIENHHLYFMVENSKKMSVLRGDSHEKVGIGIRNSIRLLESNYGDKHSFSISDREDSFNIELKVQL